MCLPSCHHGKQRELSWKSNGNLLSDFCMNPAYRQLRMVSSVALFITNPMLSPIVAVAPALWGM